jgi:hypothetical protein
VFQAQLYFSDILQEEYGLCLFPGVFWTDSKRTGKGRPVTTMRTKDPHCQDFPRQRSIMIGEYIERIPKEWRE